MQLENHLMQEAKRKIISNNLETRNILFKLCVRNIQFKPIWDVFFSSANTFVGVFVLFEFLLSTRLAANENYIDWFDWNSNAKKTVHRFEAMSTRCYEHCQTWRNQNPCHVSLFFRFAKWTHYRMAWPNWNWNAIKFDLLRMYCTRCLKRHLDRFLEQKKMKSNESENFSPTRKKSGKRM